MTEKAIGAITFYPKLFSTFLPRAGVRMGDLRPTLRGLTLNAEAEGFRFGFIYYRWRLVTLNRFI